MRTICRYTLRWEFRVVVEAFGILWVGHFTVCVKGCGNSHAGSRNIRHWSEIEWGNKRYLIG